MIEELLSKLLELENRLKQLEALDNASFVKTGDIIIRATATLPSGYLWCNGSTYNQADYPALYEEIGTTFGAGGAGTFKVPNIQDRVVQGASATDALGATGGAKLQTDVAQHSHYETYVGYRIGGGSTGALSGRLLSSTTQTNLTSQSSTENTGVAGGPDQRPPFIALHFIIKT